MPRVTQLPRGRTPELERLNDEPGRWIGDGEVKASASRGAHRFTYTEDVEWVAGGSLLLMRWTYGGQSGEEHGITVMGYDPDERKYFSYSFDAQGKTNRFMGTLDGDTLILDRMNPFERDGKRTRSRYVSERISAGRRAFRTEISTDEGLWTPLTEGTATKEP